MKKFLVTIFTTTISKSLASGLVILITLLFSGLYTNYNINKALNPTTSQINYIKEEMAELSFNCGVGTGVAWIEVQLGKSPVVEFKEVYAFVPDTAYPRSVQTESAFYTTAQNLDQDTYAYFDKQASGLGVIIKKDDEIWNTMFLQAIKANVWAGVNKYRAKAGLPPLAIDALYLVVVKKNEHIVYLVSLVLDKQLYCPMYTNTSGTLKKLGKLGSFMRTNILKESI